MTQKIYRLLIDLFCPDNISFSVLDVDWYAVVILLDKEHPFKHGSNAVVNFIVYTNNR